MSLRKQILKNKKKYRDLFNIQGSQTGFWTGQPHEKTWPQYLEESGQADPESFQTWLKDDCRWMWTENFHPEGKSAFDPYLRMDNRTGTLSEPGCLSQCESVNEVEQYPWPDPDFLDFTELIKDIKEKDENVIFTGLWSSYFHIACDFMGMENLFIQMYTISKIVDAVLDHIVSFYIDANTRFFDQLGELGDVFFFGNDPGSQRDLLISPDAFRKFILPGIVKLAAVGRKYNKKVLLHSCGSIHRIIPDLIDADVDAIHPIQVQAKGMDAESLTAYKNDLAFVGGIDTQDLLVHGSPREIKEDVYRVASLLGPNIIISPSHECLLPNVPLENVIAMREAVKDLDS